MGSWRVEFNKPDLLPAEQPAITTACTTAHKNIQALQTARYAVVYNSGGLRWWHTSIDDSKEHVTVQYFGAARESLIHVYRDGMASIRPSTARATRDVAEEDPDQ
ncbi:hypothetical protein C8Q74DRAFT_1367394 [Fomes fomentarius]|nr:hypothetical protein C8Q74DRAFT_1367394 [Fomes fomentarius]